MSNVEELIEIIHSVETHKVISSVMKSTSDQDPFFIKLSNNSHYKVYKTIADNLMVTKTRTSSENPAVYYWNNALYYGKQRIQVAVDGYRLTIRPSEFYENYLSYNFFEISIYDITLGTPEEMLFELQLHSNFESGRISDETLINLFTVYIELKNTFDNMKSELSL